MSVAVPDLVLVRPMQRFAILPVVAILGACASEPAPQPTAASKPPAKRQEFRLRATVTDLDIIPTVPLSGLPPGYILVDYDAMFGLGMRVVSISPRLAGLEKGQKVFFAIHSPSFIFNPLENPKGKTYDFILRKPEPASKLHEWSLELRTTSRPNQAMQPTASPRTASLFDD